MLLGWIGKGYAKVSGNDDDGNDTKNDDVIDTSPEAIEQENVIVDHSLKSSAKKRVVEIVQVFIVSVLLVILIVSLFSLGGNSGSTNDLKSSNTIASAPTMSVNVYHNDEEENGLNNDHVGDDDAAVPVVNEESSESNSIWYYHGTSSGLPPVKVCIVSSFSPQKSSLFIRNVLRRWGGEIEFYASKTMTEVMEEYYEIGEISREDFQPLSFNSTECPESWPRIILEMRGNQHHPGYVPQGVIAVVGDEYCDCHQTRGEKCGLGGAATFRQYHGDQFDRAKDLHYIPLGPRFEWNPVPPGSIVTASKRKFPFNFQGSLTSISRKHLVSMLDTPKVLELYPFLGKGLVKYKRSFNKMIVTKSGNSGYSEPHKYREVLLDSVFTLCPSGTSPEAYRIFEAIDAGSIPVLAMDSFYDNHGCHNAYKPYLETNAPFIFIKHWSELPSLMQKLLANKDRLDKMQRDLAIWRAEFYANVTTTVECNIMKDFQARFPDKANTLNIHDLGRFCNVKQFSYSN